MPDQPQTASPATAVATRRKPNTIADWISSEEFQNQVARVLPKHLTSERFVRVCLTALMRTPKLAQCTQQSIFQCMLTLSSFGLEPDGRRAHLIPFQNNKKCVCDHWMDKHKGDKCMVPGCTCASKTAAVECQLIIDYKGLIELMMRSGTVENIHADVVCANDEFEYDRGIVTKHRINLMEDRGPVYAAYCTVTMKGGSTKTEALSKREIDAIRDRSRAKDEGPWVTDYNEMAKKTACRRVSKWVVLSPELRDHVESDDDQYSFEHNIGPAITERQALRNQRDTLKRRLEEEEREEPQDQDEPRVVGGDAEEEGSGLSEPQKSVLAYEEILGRDLYWKILGANGCEQLEDVNEKNWQTIAGELEQAMRDLKASQTAPVSTAPLKFGKSR